MRWRQAAVAVLCVIAMTGCPSEFGKEGRVNKAVHDDTQEQLLFLTECSQAKMEEVCAPGKEDSEECRQCRLARGL